MTRSILNYLASKFGRNSNPKPRKRRSRTAMVGVFFVGLGAAGCLGHTVKETDTDASPMDCPAPDNSDAPHTECDTKGANTCYDDAWKCAAKEDFSPEVPHDICVPAEWSCKTGDTGSTGDTPTGSGSDTVIPVTSETGDTPTSTTITTSGGSSSSGPSTTTGQDSTSGGDSTTGNEVCLTTDDCEESYYCYADYTVDHPPADEFYCHDACLPLMDDAGWCQGNGGCCDGGLCNAETGYCEKQSADGQHQVNLRVRSRLSILSF